MVIRNRIRTSSSYLLDTYPATLAYSLRQIKSGVISVVRVRRSSDNAEQDFTAAQVTDGTLTSFCGVGDGFVSTWYDQSGGGYNCTALATTNQPQIVSSGALLVSGGKPFVQFSLLSALRFGIDNNFLTYFGSQTNIDFFTVNSLSHLNRSTVCIGQTNINGISHFSESDFFKVRCSTAAVNDAQITFDTGKKLSYVSKDLTTIKLAHNGGASVSTPNNYSNFVADNEFIIGQLAGYPYNTYGGGGVTQEIIFFNSSQSANRTAIESNINNYYSIY